MTWPLISTVWNNRSLLPFGEQTVWRKKIRGGALGSLIINIFNYFLKLFTLLTAIIAAMSLYGSSVAVGDLECAWFCF